jgi:phosphoadenosine phosphosulfate reductase
MVATAIVPQGAATSTSTPDVYRAGRFEPNDFAIAAEDSGGDGLILPLSALRATLDGNSIGNRRLGLLYSPADRFEEALPLAGLIAVIAIDFPKYADGRGFSHATRLVRAGFAGEIRAVGEVLIDEIPFMRRVGITAFEVRNETTRRYLSEGRDPSPSLHYQPGALPEPPVGTRPWLRRRAT